jgi:lipopolysaccharide export LptBFGC system permease protein LptF
MSRASRLLLGRGLRWLGVTTAAAALLVLLVDWVEHGSRITAGAGASALTASLQLALLLLPAHLSQAMPLVVALGCAITVVGLRRSGEWQALGGAGLGPRQLLAPFLVLGLLAGGVSTALDTLVVPWATHAHDRAMARHQDRPLRGEGATWLAHTGVAFRLRGDPDSGRLTEVAAFTLGPQPEIRTAATLEWHEQGWLPPGEQLPRHPWTLLPAPALLAELIGPEQPAGLSWRALLQDTRPSSHAELHARLSRPLSSPLAALVAAALCGLLAPGSLAVLLAAAPVLTWELAATAARTQTSLGQLPAQSIPLTRLGLGTLLLLLLLWRTRRP